VAIYGTCRRTKTKTHRDSCARGAIAHRKPGCHPRCEVTRASLVNVICLLESRVPTSTFSCFFVDHFVYLDVRLRQFRDIDGYQGTRMSSAIKGSLLRPALISGSGKTASCTLLAFGASLAPTLGEEVNSDEHDTHEQATHDATRGNVCHAMALRSVQLVRIDSLGAKGERCLLSNLRRAINGVLRKFR